MTEVLVSSTVLILALAALRLLLRGRIDPRLQYALWLLAALRLLLPVPLVSSPVSVMNAAADVPVAVQRLTAPEDRRAPQPAAEAAAAQPAAAAETQAQTKEKLPVRTILRTVWLAGAAILAIVMLAQNLRFLRKLRRVRQPLVCAESPIPVWLVPGLPSPCLAGLFRPEIYLTPEAAADPATRGFVLRHELAHYRAKDQLWSLVRLVCQCVYWFDPFVWLAAALARRDCELACDARVLHGLDGESRAAYGRALLGLVTAKPGGSQLLSGATTMQLGKKSLKERITLIAKKPKMAAYTLIFVLIFSILLAACTFTGASAQPELQPEPETVQPEEVQPAPEPEPAADAEAPQPVEDDPEASFQMAFPMLNYASFQRYLAEHPETLADGWAHIRINEAGFDDAGTSIETKQGDQVLAIDAEYGILLVRVAGEGYRGVLAVCRYPELLRLEMAENYGAEGELTGNIASDHGGILAMNANGFLDPNGGGDGSQLAGWCMSNGEGYGTHFADGAYQRIELSENGLDCRIVPASDPVGEGTYSAAEFTPALIRDGEKLENQYWTGEQPRACFGAGDQGIYMLVIEGRYPDEGIRGTSVNACADILLAYGCRNAVNMDGGSSAILWYDGEYVTQSSSSPLRYTGGRPLPNAWVYG